MNTLTSLHLQSLFEDGEPHGNSVVKESLTTQTEGGTAAADHFRGVTKLIEHGKSVESVVNHWLTTDFPSSLV